METITRLHTTIDSPIGTLLLVGEPDGDGGVVLTRLTPVDGPVSEGLEPAAFTEVARQLREYFAGTRTQFRLPLADRGTEFQLRVRRELDAIPHGETTTYGEIAARLGVARDRIRAVGAAIGANPLLVVRPCHRVVGADGSLRGYAAGLERKRALLALEGALPAVLL